MGYETRTQSLVMCFGGERRLGLGWGARVLIASTQSERNASARENHPTRARWDKAAREKDTPVLPASSSQDSPWHSPQLHDIYRQNNTKSSLFGHGICLKGRLYTFSTFCAFKIYNSVSLWVKITRKPNSIGRPSWSCLGASRQICNRMWCHKSMDHWYSLFSNFP